MKLDQKLVGQTWKQNTTIHCEKYIDSKREKLKNMRKTKNLLVRTWVRVIKIGSISDMISYNGGLQTFNCAIQV